MSASIVVNSTGLVYRNPAPHLRSAVAYHPSLSLGNGNELIATFDLGEAIESLDYHTVLSRSLDGGATWNLERRVLDAPPARTSHTIRTSRLPDGSMVGLVAIFHRDNPDTGLLNRATFGFVPMDLQLIRSSDGGRSWSRPERTGVPLRHVERRDRPESASSRPCHRPSPCEPMPGASGDRLRRRGRSSR